MRLKLNLEAVMPEMEDEVVLVGMVVGRRWETRNDANVAEALQERPSTTIVELAHIGWQRKHGKTIDIESFEDMFEIDVVNSSDEIPEVPSDPATAQSAEA